MERSQKKRVVVAMSGGVDSSVAAMLLCDAGYDVIGVMMRLWSASAEQGQTNRCCTPQGVEDARRVAAILGIPFYLVNYEEQFKTAVVDYFIAEYSRGRTPNPCLVCNRQIRFGTLLRQVLAMGADYLATGHYARVVYENGRYHLLRGIDTSKDQSYVLHVLSQEQLAHALFPVGTMTKMQVRDLARERGLPVADRQESQDICFLPNSDYRPFVAAHTPFGQTPGPILDHTGAVLGQHRGLIHYTVGQRHGLGLATGMPLYVTAIDPVRNALIVGPAKALLRHELTVSNVNYVAGEPPAATFSCRIQLRYRAKDAPATVHVLPGNRAAITFESPQRAITPGQAAVFYEGDEVLGGGIIE